MKLDHPWLKKLGGLGIVAFARHWMGTLDYQALFYDPRVDPVHPDFEGPALYIFWHEYMLFPFYLRGNCRIAMLLSRHRDAEWLAHAARYMGFDLVRGSVRRGGAGALLEMMRKGRLSNLTIACDGPKGPRRRMAPGVPYLASRLGIPVVGLGMGYDRPWRASSWDQFAVPRLFSRARAIVSPPIYVPRELDRAGLERYRLRFEELLNELNTEAELWALAGTRRPLQVPVCREGTRWRPVIQKLVGSTSCDSKRSFVIETSKSSKAA